MTTTAAVTFGSTTAGLFDATGGLGSNHFQALRASGLYMQMFTGEAGVSFTNGVIGYNYGNLSGSSAGRLTVGLGRRPNPICRRWLGRADLDGHCRHLPLYL